MFIKVCDSTMQKIRKMYNSPSFENNFAVNCFNENFDLVRFHS